jgi:D-alanine-D-alanine ligase
MKTAFTIRPRIKPKNIGIIVGGSKWEIEYAEGSAREVEQALSNMGYKSTLIYFNNGIIRNLKNNKIDVAFIIDASYIGGKDEVKDLRELLDELRIPYTASNREAAEKAKNKVKSKQAFVSAGLMTPKYLEIKDGLGLSKIMDLIERNLRPPFIIKPRDEGTSVGVTYVAKTKELKKQIYALLKQFHKIILEEYIKGVELTVPILEIQDQILALDVIEIEKSLKIYSYKIKQMGLHEDERSNYIKFHYPARIDKKLSYRVAESAINAHKSVNCHGYSRVDTIVNDAGDIYMIEINALPLLFKDDFHALAAERKGIMYDQLVELILNSAFKN